MHTPCFALSLFAVIFILLVILAIKFSLCFYFVIDKGLGPIKALKASSMATTGASLSLFFFYIVCSLINLLGAFCFIIGLFATVPITVLAMADAYRQLSEQTPELADLGIGGQQVQPSGVGGTTQSFAGMQPNPIIPSIQSIQSGPDIQHGQGVQTIPSTLPNQSVQPSPSVQSAQGVQPDRGIRPVSAIRNEEGKKDNKSLIFWVTILVIVSVAFAAFIGYRLWLKSKEKIVVASNGDKVSVKEVSLTAILYSEDKPLAMIEGKIAKEGDIIDGITVVKINKNDVEFEKDGANWTQRPAGKSKTK